MTTETEETYNGWRNRETWALNLHLSNNEGDYRMALEEAKSILAFHDATDDLARSPQGLMAEWIERWAEWARESVLFPEDGMAPTDAARMLVADVGSFNRVDYYEIAISWIRDAQDGLEVGA